MDDVRPVLPAGCGGVDLLRQNTKSAVEFRRLAQNRRLDKELERILSILSKRDDVHRVILFGSVARGQVGSRSDLDIVVIADSNARFADRIESFLCCVRPEVSMDILVYTPAEWERLIQERSFHQRVAREGKIIYEDAA